MDSPVNDPHVALKLAMARGREVSMALQIYHQAHDAWPTDLASLVAEGMLKAGSLVNPRRPGKDPGFLYFPPTNETLPDEGVLFEPISDDQGAVDGWPGNGLVVCYDGHVEQIENRGRYEALLAQARGRSKEPK